MLSLRSRIDLKSKKDKLLEKFINILDKCNDETQLAALERFLIPMKPTISVLSRSQQTFENVQVTPSSSQGSGRKISPQRRLWSKKTYSKKQKTVTSVNN